jgi:hypothetical protein
MAHTPKSRVLDCRGKLAADIIAATCHGLIPIQAPDRSPDEEDDATTPHDKGKAPDRSPDQLDEPETPNPKRTSAASPSHSTSDSDGSAIIPQAIPQAMFQTPSLIRSTTTASTPLMHLTEAAPTPSGSKMPPPGVTVWELCRRLKPFHM